MIDYIAESIIKEKLPPHNFIVDIVKKDDVPNINFIRFYADDLLSHTKTQAEDLTVWLNNVLKKLNNSLSITRWTWEVAETTPPNRK